VGKEVIIYGLPQQTVANDGNVFFLSVGQIIQSPFETIGQVHPLNPKGNYMYRLLYH
jgi:hypothetical protein